MLFHNVHLQIARTFDFRKNYMMMGREKKRGGQVSRKVKRMMGRENKAINKVVN